MGIRFVTPDSLGALGGLVVITLARIVRDQGSIPSLRHRFFLCIGTNCYICRLITDSLTSCLFGWKSKDMVSSKESQRHSGQLGVLSDPVI